VSSPGRFIVVINPSSAPARGTVCHPHAMRESCLSARGKRKKPSRGSKAANSQGIFPLIPPIAGRRAAQAGNRRWTTGEGGL
jgi:hypothetical protein